MVLKIGNLDILPYVAEDGLKISRNDLDGNNAGRTMSGTMIRDRVAVKKRIDVTCRDLTQAESEILLNAVYPPFVDVRYTDPQEGEVTKRMYSNNIPASVYSLDSNGVPVWSGITFPLIER